MKILVSGGHLTPALAFIDYVKQNQPDVDFVFVGREYSQDAVKQKSQEKLELQQRNIPFISFQAVRFSLLLSWRAPYASILFLKSFFHAISIFGKQRPDCFLSFGGYLALPLALAAWLWKIPIITHEQTHTLGIANRLIGNLASTLAVAHPNTTGLGRISPNKIVITGNPIRTQLFDTIEKTPDWLAQIDPTKPILYITGGNQGSEIINSVISQALSRLTKKWQIIHQCGNPTQKVNYKEDLEKKRQQLPQSRQAAYIVKEWISQTDLAWIFQHVSAIISRSGANTIEEIIAFELPAILIPLPFSYQQEQLVNAQFLVKKGGALMVQQKDLNADSIIEATETLLKQRKKIQNKLELLQLKDYQQPAKLLYQTIKSAYEANQHKS